MTEHKEGGFYVDIGCRDAEINSNTRAFDDFGWTGLMVDIVGGCERRKGTFIRCDAANPGDRLKFSYSQLPPVCDYLSLDCDDSTIGAFHALPWDRVTWRVLTIETDVYRNGESHRDTMRTQMQAMGYHLVCGDVVVEWPAGTFVPFEDWFVHPGLVNPELVTRFQGDGRYWKDILLTIPTGFAARPAAVAAMRTRPAGQAGN